MKIGFDSATFTFTETDSTVSRPVSVSVQSGSLARDVVVTVQTVDATATGEGCIYLHYVHVCYMSTDIVNVQGVVLFYVLYHSPSSSI